MSKARRLWETGAMMLVGMMIVGPLKAADPSSINLTYCNTVSEVSTNTIGNKIRVINSTTEALDLEALKIRYYYTKDEELAQHFWCDHAGINGEGVYEAVTDCITYSIKEMSIPYEEADTYIEIGFKEGTRQLMPGENITLQSRIANEEWRQYTQINDYSYQANTNEYEVNDHVILYYKGRCVSGEEPQTKEEVIDSEITPLQSVYDKNEEVKSTCQYQIAFNNNALKEIRNGEEVISSQNYTIDDQDILTFTQEYLHHLPVGNYELTLDFEPGQDKRVCIEVIDTTDKVDHDFAMTVSTVTFKEGETYVIPVELNNVSKGINNAAFAFYYDRTLIQIEEIIAGEIIPEKDKSLITAIHQEKGTFNILFAAEKQDGSQLIEESGKLLEVRVSALKSDKTVPFDVKDMRDIGDEQLKPIEVVFKEK